MISTHRFRAAHVPAASLLLLAIGCGEKFDVAPVSGKITNQGRPVAGVFVTFQPVGSSLTDEVGPAAYGHTDDDGQFELKLITDERPGAVVGQHRVILQHRDDENLPHPDVQEDSTGSESDAADMQAARRRTFQDRKIPQAFRDGSVRFEVSPTGSTSADFDLARP